MLQATQNMQDGGYEKIWMLLAEKQISSVFA